MSSPKTKDQHLLEKNYTVLIKHPSKIYGHAEALRSQTQQFDREMALQTMNLKTLGLAMSRSSDPRNLKDEIFDSLISISKQQLEETDDPKRMTRSELNSHNTKGIN